MRQLPHWWSCLALFAWLLAAPAVSQTPAPQPAHDWAALAKQAADLTLPREPSRMGLFTTPQLALFKPDGPGPFPALVLLHQCGGLRNPASSWQNRGMLEWARDGVARGYVVLLLDSLGPRGVDTVCPGPRAGVTFVRGALDVLQATRHLGEMPFVDPRRVAVLGASWGGAAAALAGSRGLAETLAPDGAKPVAIASLYPVCRTVVGGYHTVQPDMATPWLVLAGDQDEETPARLCEAAAETVRQQGGHAVVHTYSGAGHCFDCENLHGYRKTLPNGTPVQYLYDRDARRDAVERVFQFFEQALREGR